MSPDVLIPARAVLIFAGGRREHGSDVEVILSRLTSSVITRSRGKRCFFLWRKHGGRSRLVLRIGSGGRFLTSLMFPVYCCAFKSQLHSNVAGKMKARGGEREQSVVSESLCGGPELCSTIPKPGHLGRA